LEARRALRVNLSPALAETLRWAARPVRDQAEAFLSEWVLRNDSGVDLALSRAAQSPGANSAVRCATGTQAALPGWTPTAHARLDFGPEWHPVANVRLDSVGTVALDLYPVSAPQRRLAKLAVSVTVRWHQLAAGQRAGRSTLGPCWCAWRAR
jgi:hypothetical protein